MSNVEFETDMDSNPRYVSRGSSAGVPAGASRYGQGQRRGMTGWLIRHGIVNNDSGAQSVLIGFVCVNFIVAGLILYFFVLS